jgi:signal transduction histidine kinase/DNA-binding response OmpR family regulator/ligand-binding sensor domain-containing protein
MYKNLINLRLLFAVFLWSVSQIGVAQKPTAYETVGSAEGLSQGMVLDILQDKEGFLWVATRDGLNRYDGYRFKIFTNDPNDSKTLSSNSIVKLFEDSKGRIWVGTENDGLNVYDKNTGAFFRINYSVDNPNGLASNIIKLIEEMPNGNILVATENGVLHIITLAENFLNPKVVPKITKIHLPNKDKIYGIGNDSKANTWIGSMNGGVYKFDGLNNSFTPIANGQLLNNGYLTSDSSILINTNLYLYNGITVTPLFDTVKIPMGNIIFKPIKALWDKHHREVFNYDISTWMPNKTINWGLKLQLTKRINYPFIFDKAGLIWSGTVGYGLKKFNIANEKFNAQVNNFSIFSIIPKGNETTFLGDVGYTWKQINKDKTVTNAFANLPSIKQLDNFLITKAGDYWFKSDNQGYFKNNNKTNQLTPYANINNYNGRGSKQPIMEDTKNQIWFPGMGGDFMLFNTITENITTININTNTAKPIDKEAICTALLEDKDGAYWIGTMNGFAKVILPNTQNSELQVKWYYNESNTNSLNYNHVCCFLIDPTDPNYLWIGTKGGGLNRFEKSTGNFLHLTIKDGLPDNVVYGLLADEAKNIWGSTNKGLFSMLANKDKNNNWQFRNFTKADGLQDNEFNTNAYAYMPNGQLGFGGVNGLNIFDPKVILANTFIPNVFITNILINNKPIVPNDETGVLTQAIEFTKTITLNYLQDILTLEFAALDFTKAMQNKYRYKLEGADKEWVDAGSNRSATYLHLKAGKYTFKVQGSNSQGVWSDKIAELKIIVRPPWWKTWLAYLFYLLAVGFGIRAYFKFKVNKVKLQNQLNYQQEESQRIKELDEVKTKLYTNITHEFRTPLTVILGMAQQIKNNTTEHLDNGLNMIIRNGQSLLNLVNEMLDLSKLESGKMDLQLQDGDVINFLKYIVESFQSLAESQKKQLHFLTDLDTLYTHYDAEKIRQIVANLLSNAIKFTPEKGNVYISVSEITATPKSETLTLILKIKDTGIGIPESQLENIFDRFYQLDNSATRNAEGTGIGLSLTRELTKLMNGKIEVNSPPKGASIGSEFIVSIPFTKMEAAEGKITAPLIKHTLITANEALPIIDTADVNQQSPLILLVEDNADVVAYTASCLPHYKLAVGKDGREGFDIAKDIIPDLIITDVMMPFVDGFEMCHKLRQNEFTSHIPIIMLTAKADIESRLEGLEKGADVYLEKPFKEELLIRIKKLLELRKKLQEYYSKKIGFTNIDITENSTEIVVEVWPEIETAIENEFVKKLRTIIESNFNNYEFNVEQLCKQIFMSHSQLHRKLDALTGQSPNKFIRLVKLQHAKKLLQNEKLSISSIALDCGYNDAGYFTRVFKQAFGVTPQEWRGKIGV